MLKLYKHYKGNFYIVVGEGRHSETEEEFVIYQSVKEGSLWIRPKEMFYEKVEINGQWVPRFEEIR
ncbi:DUF1653 domain-containing protein [Fodinisporobacter ferrooxydans]|uniref:DUF1653 domain-containing protein n=1 Tax=Fodinisporobacter ferrooxydans TaxID=2901836 RepID=A0ABY4CLA5_9BACL|nr:DUF1653 domain-containing protein [Alicyclobacillaceae bacterium MYW30-H2]